VQTLIECQFTAPTLIKLTTEANVYEKHFLQLDNESLPCEIVIKSANGGGGNFSDIHAMRETETARTRRNERKLQITSPHLKEQYKIKILTYCSISGCRWGTRCLSQREKMFQNVWRSCDRASLMYSFKFNQQDATLYNILYCCQCSTCFRRFFRPSSGAQTAHTASGICQACLLLPLSLVRWHCQLTNSVTVLGF